MILPIILHRPVAPDVMAFLNRVGLERRRAKLAKALADLATSTIAPGTTARVRLVLEAQRVSRRVAFERELAELHAGLAVMP